LEYIDLRKRVRRAGLNLKELAKIIGVTYVAVTSWKKNGIPYYVNPLIEMLELLTLEQREKFFAEKLGEK
jgi:transcriptional regulator with XRE-family HTH domain